MNLTSEEKLNQYFEVALKIVKKAGEVVNDAIKSREKKSKKLYQFYRVLTFGSYPSYL